MVDNSLTGTFIEPPLSSSRKAELYAMVLPTCLCVCYFVGLFVCRLCFSWYNWGSFLLMQFWGLIPAAYRQPRYTAWCLLFFLHVEKNAREIYSCGIAYYKLVRVILEIKSEP